MNSEKKARELIKGLSMSEILLQWDLTEISDDPNIPTVRGWLMDEMRSRNAVAFDLWIEDYDSSPRKYFC